MGGGWEMGGWRWEVRDGREEGRVELGRAGPGWVGLGWVGLGWVELGWVGLGELVGWVRKSGASELTISASKIRRAIDRCRCLFKG
uniref:Uncharacterized protein n=1 Tax=Vespula pensylvanica TaxID=30213 RepID=A0A834UF34_VESPE|nr:hypothetical protein H0235_003559 [Vespula pensylvanica]